MKIAPYLSRIKFKQPVRTDLQTLASLQRHHLLHVPFENLDIHYQKRICLDQDAIYDKVIRQKRGGFCYELNGLFYALLRELCFEVKMISARVYKHDGSYSPEFDHMALLVVMENDIYLVDVGFGSFSLEPFWLSEHVIRNDPHGNFIFDSYEDRYRINLLENGKHFPQYIFTSQSRKLEDFSTMYHFHQQSNDSHLLKKKVVSLAKEDGRITLSDDYYKVTKNGKTEELSFDPVLFEKKLEEIFGISLYV